MKSRIKGEKIIRIGVATAGILLLALAAFAYQASCHTQITAPQPR
jgi:hypothetical protein